ncbi:DegT/DnrJ/EryC1/StrS family aminotransferase [Flavilitoribacter nigricans]|uniref:Aminotransferase n=1 Tax=Flavilitoribacter nigricans (strain ATCC 23147 / DSM 23189 / NBRC 102662 / NCIMB 1420 / SS-2) TaxID=1122177 RepID=A0A2D0MYY8_FLAN2|nr:DegT/DnrJ/EryC1/StrS family aminotransferase [Flavilitoribacter nigricans]PHN01502.1 aminotransferase [Flavilitoribacter nigricans DSM 23189 = NBRC 102662]
MSVPFLNLEPMHSAIKEEIFQAFESVYNNNWFILGEKLSLFESEYSEFSGTRYSVGVSNGLDALILSLKALGIGEGDEVIVPSNTFFASALAISHSGAKPIFVEPSIDTYNIDPEQIANAVTERTRAIMPVHLYGQACDMAAITEIASIHNLVVVEDNAQAHGCHFAGKTTGSWGHINGTSFYPGKNLGALGDGGMITTDNKELYECAQMLRNYGSKEKYQNEKLGYNMRLDELQAAFLSIKLKNISRWNKQRQEIAGLYDNYLAEESEIITPKTHPDAEHVYHLYVIRTRYRDELKDFLQTKGISTLIHYPIPPHLQNAYKNLKHKLGDFPIAEELSNTSLSLPIWPGMSVEQIGMVSNTISEFFK